MRAGLFFSVVVLGLAHATFLQVIFIHGLGDTGHGWADAADMFGPMVPHARFIFPTAPSRRVTLNQGMLMPAWYDIYGLTLEARNDEVGLEESRKTIMSLIAKEEAAGIPSNRIVLAGFSQGAAMSLYTGLQYDKPLGGLVGLSGYLPMAHKFPEALHPANKTTPILLCHGDADQIVSFTWGLASSEKLKQCGLPVEFKMYRHMGHSASPAELRDVGVFLAARLPPTA